MFGKSQIMVFQVLLCSAGKIPFSFALVALTFFNRHLNWVEVVQNNCCAMGVSRFNRKRLEKCFVRKLQLNQPKLAQIKTLLSSTTRTLMLSDMLSTQWEKGGKKPGENDGKGPGSGNRRGQEARFPSPTPSLLEGSGIKRKTHATWHNILQSKKGRGTWASMKRGVAENGTFEPSLPPLASFAAEKQKMFFFYFSSTSFRFRSKCYVLAQTVKQQESDVSATTFPRLCMDLQALEF